MDARLIPAIGYSDASKIYGKSVSWFNYARRITFNPFMMFFLLEREGHSCPWCRKPIESRPVIHHINYLHECRYGKTIFIATPTEKRPKRGREIPDCKTCNISKREFFDSCIDRLTVVHTECNGSIAFSRKT